MQTSLTRRLLLAAATVAVVASFDVGGALAQEAPAAAAAIAEASASSKYVFNTLLFLVAGFLVMFMAAGFAMLEAGLVRTKNVSMQCTKNIVLYAIGGIMFWLVGYNLMYDGVAGGYFGSFLPKVIPPTDNDPGNYAAASDWFFQMV
ncbi:MAG: ammonium transporter, partial [Hyphomicrobiaceae bacterium]|nr:ammonium transporter [Hyphomicrobiaceae bacterium]